MWMYSPAFLRSHFQKSLLRQLQISGRRGVNATVSVLWPCALGPAGPMWVEVDRHPYSNAVSLFVFIFIRESFPSPLSSFWRWYWKWHGEFFFNSFVSRHNNMRASISGKERIAKGHANRFYMWAATIRSRNFQLHFVYFCESPSSGRGKLGNSAVEACVQSFWNPVRWTQKGWRTNNKQTYKSQSHCVFRYHPQHVLEHNSNAGRTQSTCWPQQTCW